MSHLPLAFVSVIAVCLAAGPSPMLPAAGKDVRVINGEEEPVPVFDIGVELRQPFQKQVVVDVSGFFNRLMFTVPPNRRAVIETVSAQLSTPGSSGLGAVVNLETTVGDDTAAHSLVLAPQGVVFTSEVRAANHGVRLYGDPETRILLSGIAEAGSTLYVTVSGYLVILRD